MNRNATQLKHQNRFEWKQNPKLVIPLVSAIFWVAFGSMLPAAAQTVVDEKAAQSEISDDGSLLDQLSKGRYSTRQRATLKMWGSRDELRDQVQAATRHPNPEVSGRANWILDQWRRGTSPDMPPRVMRLLQKGDDPGAIVELVEMGRFRDAIVAVEESKGSIEFERIQAELTAAFTLRFPFYVKQALDDGSLDLMLKLIDLSATNKEMSVCRIRMMQSMGHEIAKDDLLPSAASSWTAAARDEALVAVHTVLHDQDQAIAIAHKSPDDNLLRASLMLAGKWQELSDLNLAKADATGAIEPQSRSELNVIHWVHALVAADRCGDKMTAQRAIDALTAVPSEQAGYDLAWKALALHGQMEGVFKMLDDDSPESLADVGLAASRPGRVFEELNFPIAQLDSNLSKWIDEAIGKQITDSDLLAEPDAPTQRARGRRNNPDGPNLAIRRLIALMQCLIAIGRDDAARQIAERLSAESIEFGSRPNTRTLRDYVLQSLVSTSRSEWVYDLAVADDAKEVSLTAYWCLSSGSLLDVESTTFSVILDAIQQMYRGIPFPERFQMTCELMQGEIPERFERDRDFERLFKSLTNQTSSSLFSRRVQIPDGSQINHDIVKFFARHGQAALSNRCLTDLIRKGDLEALYEFAVREADSGNAEQSDQFFDLAWNRAQQNGRSLGLSRFEESDAIMAMKTLVAQWRGASRAGNQELTEQLARQISLTALSPSTEFLDAMAEHLSEHGHEELAKEIFEVLLPLTALGSSEATEFYDVARKYSAMIRDKEAHSAIKWFDMAVGGTLDSTYFRSSAYITLPVYIRRWALEAAIADGDQSAAVEHLERLTELDPLDIAFAEDVLPKMRDSGMAKLANHAFDQLFDAGVKHCQQFPFDATTCNNVAWVAAMNDRRLDEALLLSEQSVMIEPDSAIYRDTLAEILFRLDRKKEALHVEESCLLDDPTQWHIHEQIGKYREAVLSDLVEKPE
ncbi:MAG: hypothetical protein WBD20_03245 [Pirellulaceae bacterium]